MTKPRELLCMVCGRDYVTWYAPNPLWNRVMRLPDGSDRLPFVCAACFASKAVEAGVDAVFELRVAPVIIEGQTFEGGVVCGCDCGCSRSLNDGNAMRQDVTDADPKPWERAPESPHVHLLLCADCFTGAHHENYGACGTCGSQRIRRESPTGGWFTICPNCPPGQPANPEP